MDQKFSLYCFQSRTKRISVEPSHSPFLPKMNGADDAALFFGLVTLFIVIFAVLGVVARKTGFAQPRAEGASAPLV